MQAAWLTANLTRARRLPPLPSLLGDAASRKVTAEEHAWAEQIRAAEGFPQIPDHLRRPSRGGQQV